MRLYLDPDENDGGGGEVSGADIERGFKEAEAGGVAVAEPDDDPAPAAGESAEGQGQGAQNWASQPLPAELASRFPNVRNMGEFVSKYENSSGEARRYMQAAQQQQQLAEGYRALIATGMRPAQAAQPAQQQAAAAQNWYGFGSKEAYSAALQADPQGTMNKILAWGIQNNPDQIKSIVQPLLDQAIAPMRQTSFEHSMQAQSSDFFNRYPEFKDGNSPLNQMARRYLQENPWLGELPRLAPGVNFPEAVAKLATYDALMGELKALKGKFVDKRGRSGTARPTTFAGKVPSAKKGSAADNIRAAAADAAAQGFDVSQAMVDQAIRAFANEFPDLG